MSYMGTDCVPRVLLRSLTVLFQLKTSVACTMNLTNNNYFLANEPFPLNSLKKIKLSLNLSL